MWFVPLIVGLASVAALHAQAPAVARNGVRNAASLIPGDLAPGARIVIRGVRFGSEKDRVVVTIGSVKLAIDSVSPEKIEARVPRNAPLGVHGMFIRTGQGSSAILRVRVAESATGLYSRNGRGFGPGDIANHDSDHPASPGERIVLRATGIGRNPTVLVAGRKVATQARGNEELEITLPDDVPEGCFVPITAVNTVTVAIRKGGGRCRVAEDFPFGLWKPAKSGLALLIRTLAKDLDSIAEVTRDEVVVEFLEARADGRFPGPLLYAPPDGVCTSNVSESEPGTGMQLLPFLFGGAASGRGLNGGEWLSINNGRVQRRVLPKFGVAGMYQALLGGVADPEARRQRLGPFLDRGRFSLEGQGGVDVGAWRLDMPAPVAVRWPGRDRASHLKRGQPLELEWQSGSAPQRMMIVAGSQDPDSQLAGFCQCMTNTGAGKFTIPAALLNRLPGPSGLLWLIAWPDHAPDQIPAAGFAQSAAMSIFSLRQEFRFEP